MSSSSYAVISLTTDRLRGTVVPVGVALWSRESSEVRLRVVRRDEVLLGVTDVDQAFVRLVEAQLRSWIKEPVTLPWLREPFVPSMDGWWRAARKVLVHRILLTDPRPIDCIVSDENLELLFKQVVGPKPRQAEPPKVSEVVRLQALGLGSVEANQTFDRYYLLDPDVLLTDPAAHLGAVEFLWTNLRTNWNVIPVVATYMPKADFPLAGGTLLNPVIRDFVWKSPSSPQAARVASTKVPISEPPPPSGDARGS